MNAERIAFLIVASLVTPLAGQQSLESDYRTTGKAVTAVFESQRAVLQTSSAVILDGRKEISYGVLVSADGHILTKASEFSKTSENFPSRWTARTTRTCKSSPPIRSGTSRCSRLKPRH